MRKKFVLDTYENHLDITFVVLPSTDAFYQIQGVFKHNWIVEDLSRPGMLQSGKMYVIYYEGGHVSACADAAYQGHEFYSGTRWCISRQASVWTHRTGRHLDMSVILPKI